MAAPKGSSDSGNTAVVVMIIFIVLFLISAGFAIAFYVNIETCNKRANDATAKLGRLGNTSQVSEVEKLAESSGLDSGTTFDKLDAVIKSFSESIIGKNAVNYSMATAKANVDSSLSGIWASVAEVQGMDPISQIEDVKASGLVGAVKILVGMMEDMNSQFMAYQQQMDKQLTLNQQTIDKYEDRIAQLQDEVDSLGMTVANMQNQTNDNIEDIKSRFQSHFNSLQSEKDEIVKESEGYKKKLEVELEQAALLNEKAEQMEKFLRDTRQKPTQEIEALDPDGTIISVDAREQMVYIDLAAEDKIYRGLTFSVYDGLEKAVSASGQGKATIEVVEILGSISRCRVVESQTTNPIIKGDIIANLVWDKDREFVFCVVGEFDFNMDGEVDIDGYDRVETLIKGWGGKVQDYVGVDTDFLVYGYKPNADNLGDALEGDATEMASSVEATEEKAKLYDKALDEGVRLGVPSFNMQRFFRFIGYSKKQVMN